MGVLVDGELLRRTREKKGWSQKKLADEAEIVESTVQRLEQGGPSAGATVRMVCDKLGLAPETVIRLGDGESTGPTSNVETPSKSTSIATPDAPAERAPPFQSNQQPHGSSIANKQNAHAHRPSFHSLPPRECRLLFGREEEIAQLAPGAKLTAILRFSELANLAQQTYNFSAGPEKRAIALAALSELVFLNRICAKVSAKGGFAALLKRHDFLTGAEF